MLTRMSPQELRTAVTRGLVRLGPGTTGMIIPILLPEACCRDAHRAACARCGRSGWTHGWHAQGDLRCGECEEYLAPAVHQWIYG